MRIAYFTGTYPRATDTFIQREVSALRQRGAEVFTFAVRPPHEGQLVSDTQRTEKHRTQYLLPASPGSLLGAHLSLLIARPRAYASALGLAWRTRVLGVKGSLYQFFYFIEAGSLAAQIRQQRIQHLHNHFGDSSCSVAMLAAALGDFSYSFTLHGPGIFFEPERWRLDEKIRRASFVSCISYFCRSQAMIFAPYEKWPDLHIVHCGVEPSQFPRREHHGVGKQLLYVGRLAAAKGLPILLKSLALMQTDSSARMQGQNRCQGESHTDVYLTVVGDGPDRAMLEAEVERLGLQAQVNFVGYQSSAAVRDYLAKTDVFVMSSFAEGVPVVLMEAMASAVPVVAPQIAGISELVTHGQTGYLVPPSDPLQLSQRILALLQDPIQRQQFGDLGRAHVSQCFNISLEASKLSDLITTHLSASNGTETDQLATDLSHLTPGDTSHASLSL